MAILGCALAFGCTRPRTEVRVRLITNIDYGPGATVQSIRVIVRSGGPDGVSVGDRPLALGQGPGFFPMPISFGVTPLSTDDTGLVWIEAIACSDAMGCMGDGGAGFALVTQRALTSFVPGYTSDVDLYLAGACLHVRCDDPRTTCDPCRGVCVDVSGRPRHPDCAATSRPIAPLSTATVTSRRPTLRWQLAAGTEGARVELCRDRACTRVVEALTATGASVLPAADLSPGVYYWRLRGRADVGTGAVLGPTWQFVVGAGNASIDTSWGTTFDVNGDGYADLVVGAYRATSGGLADLGAAYVFHGGPLGLSTSARPTTTLRGTFADNVFGSSVASAGDVNGDGYADLVVGAYDAATSGAHAGAAYVYFGAAERLDERLQSSFSGATGDAFGTTVAGVGDINHDGYADVIVGAPATDPPGRIDAGAVYVYFGSAMGLSPDRCALEGIAAGDHFGFSVAGAGDVNGDGFADLVVGAYGADDTVRGVDAGAAYVYLGSATWRCSPANRVLRGMAAYDAFGEAVGGAGDVNGDGYADVIVGASGADPQGHILAGEAYVYFGTDAGIPDRPNHTLYGVAAIDSFGSSVAGAGDVDGDGNGDIVVGAHGVASEAGAAYVYFGSSTGLVPDQSGVQPRVLLGVAASDHFGSCVAGAGDINGDGYADVAVGAYGTRSSAGAAYVYPGGSRSNIFMGVPIVLGGWSNANDVFGNWLARADSPRHRVMSQRHSTRRRLDLSERLGSHPSK